MPGPARSAMNGGFDERYGEGMDGRRNVALDSDGGPADRCDRQAVDEMTRQLGRAPRRKVAKDRALKTTIPEIRELTSNEVASWCLGARTKPVVPRLDVLLRPLRVAQSLPKESR